MLPHEILLHKLDNQPVPIQLPTTVRELLGLPVEQSLNFKDIVYNSSDGILTSYEDRMRFLLASFVRIAKATTNKLNHSAVSSTSQISTSTEIDKTMRYANEVLEHFLKQLRSVSADDAHKKPIHTYQAIFTDYLQYLEFLLEENILPSLNILLDKKLSASKLLFLADEYEVFAKRKDTLVTVTPHSQQDGHFIIQIEKPECPLSLQMAKEYLATKTRSLIMPDWYQKMSAAEQFLFDDMMKDVNNENELLAKVETISSRHRTIPGVPNFSRHRMAIVDDKGNIVYRTPYRFRSSMMASRDWKHESLYDLNVRSSSANVDLIIATFQAHLEREIANPLNKYLYCKPDGSVDIDKLSNLPILFQTLISPLVPSVIAPDSRLYKIKKEVIDRLRKKGVQLRVNGVDVTLKNIIETNHPINGARYVERSGFSNEKIDNEHHIPALVELTRLALKKIIAEKWPDREISAYITMMAGAADELERICLNPSMMDDNHRELHLAGLEEFLVSNLGGLSYGSCVSGKDRKALEIIYTDAIEIYYQRYSEIPKCNDTGLNRNRFIELYTDLYLSYHHQVNAGQNAPGSEGIKKVPDPLPNYLPDDISRAIKAKSGNTNIFVESNQLATNNNVKDRLSAVKALDASTKQTYRTIYRNYGASLDTSNNLFRSAEQSTSSTSSTTKVTTDERDIGAALLTIKKIVESSLMDKLGILKKLNYTFTPAGICDLRDVFAKWNGRSRDALMTELAEKARKRFYKDTQRDGYVDRLYSIIVGLESKKESQRWMAELTQLDADILNERMAAASLRNSK